MSVSSKANFSDRPRYSRLAHARLLFITPTYCEDIRSRIRSAGWFASRTVSEKVIVNDRWTSNGQHVLHTATHTIYLRVSRMRKRRLRDVHRGPFVLRRTGRSASLKNACATSALLLTSPRRSKWISAGRLGHESRLLSTRSNLARNASKGYRKA